MSVVQEVARPQDMTVFHPRSHTQLTHVKRMVSGHKCRSAQFSTAGQAYMIYLI